jgi:hypothetical protein
LLVRAVCEYVPIRLGIGIIQAYCFEVNCVVIRLRASW